MITPGSNATKTTWIVKEDMEPTHVLKTLQVRKKDKKSPNFLFLTAPWLSRNQAKRPKTLELGLHFKLQPFLFSVQCDDEEGNKFPSNVIDVDEGIGKQIWIKNI